MYDYVIVTHLPAFYKVNLYNELAKKLNIFVVFIAKDTNETRASDFVTLHNAHFEYTVLSLVPFQSRDKLSSLYQLFSMVRQTDYKKILLSGWDLPEFWLVALMSPNQKNCLALESTILESNATGIKGLIKKTFLAFIGTVFASGDLHVELLEALNFKKNIRVTKGVGIINKPILSMQHKMYQKKFLYVGRLSMVKNLEMLINVFNVLPEHQLTIIGDGEEKKYLESIANGNVTFLGSIENDKLKEEYNKNDIFILPSESEPWGLVVEEALYFGLPVIVSKNCGACELIEDGKNGFIISPNDHEQIKLIIENIETSTFNKLLVGVKQFSISSKDEIQVSVY